MRTTSGRAEPIQVGTTFLCVLQATRSACEWPILPGTYVLGLHLREDREVTVGRFGTFAFSAGLYAYVGSACGPGGLRARLERHWRGPRRSHWHVDYLRHVASLQWVIWQTAPELECSWSQTLAALPGAFAPVPGFGATDCPHGCPAHLFLLPPQADPLAVAAWLAKKVPGTLLI